MIKRALKGLYFDGSKKIENTAKCVRLMSTRFQMKPSSFYGIRCFLGEGGGRVKFLLGKHISERRSISILPAK